MPQSNQLTSDQLRQRLRTGLVIPAHPLALTADRKLDPQRQRALSRYYLSAGAGGLAVAVHTTQFSIREPQFNLLQPVLELACEVAGEFPQRQPLMITGVCGETAQAVQEAELAASLGYHAGLLSLAAWANRADDELIEHARCVSQSIPLVGFYLQPSVGGRRLSFDFWSRFCQIPEVVAVKVAPFNRYQTLDVVRAVQESGRAAEIALLTGNDDSIVVDLLSEYSFERGSDSRIGFCGGLLGHWACWTQAAVAWMERLKVARESGYKNERLSELLTLANQITDMNAAIFDAANDYRGCIAGIHEVLRRQGLLLGTWCLDPHEQLSPGQAEEISRVCRSYPELTDDDFIRDNLICGLASGCSGRGYESLKRRDHTDDS
ncbi:MAG: dihydrodipicolinate synthase family protein [Pirellulaceae bacterium]